MQRIEEIPAALGFVETRRLIFLRQAWIAAICSNGDVHGASNEYLTVAEALADQAEGEDVRIGLNIQVALIHQDAGRMDQYLNDLNDALEQIFGTGRKDLEAILEREIELYKD